MKLLFILAINLVFFAISAYGQSVETFSLNPFYGISQDGLSIGSAGELRVEGSDQVNEGLIQWFDFKVGTLDPNLKEYYSIYPNPVISNLTIEVEKEMSLLIYDINGRIVKPKKSLIGVTNQNLSDLPDGLYLLKLVTMEGKYSIETINKFKE